MTVQSHLQELKRKHAALETEISRELASPGSDPLRLVELKRRKLALKEQITKLHADVTVH
ncbi:MAG: DUF465 domain-containing protein [Azorhizobium sp. 35-67-5]|jgi:hypothetical protein|nr:MAG: DUF465 domain-containing protein [Rhizobiales bacterium 12-68-15]OYX88459.1 MAG: DUF465 domain-containing protein [Azorhizobium sp. 35-67-5]OYX89894.1 MAG: DUF465 domain-containing protein [Azorhizobium sp. 32-67-21]